MNKNRNLKGEYRGKQYDVVISVEESYVLHGGFMDTGYRIVSAYVDGSIVDDNIEDSVDLIDFIEDYLNK